MLAPVDNIEIDTKLVRRPEMSFQSMPKLILADSKDDSKDRSSQQCHMILIEFSPLYLWYCCTYEALVSKSVVVTIVCFNLACTIQLMPSTSSSMMRSCPASLYPLRHCISPRGSYMASVSRASGISPHRVGQHKRQPDSHRGNPALKVGGRSSSSTLLLILQTRWNFPTAPKI